MSGCHVPDISRRQSCGVKGATAVRGQTTLFLLPQSCMQPLTKWI